MRRRVALTVLMVASSLTASLGCRPAPPPPPVLGQVPPFELTDHHGRVVSRNDLLGTPWVADFVFTRCTLICPRMTAQMKRIEQANLDRPVRFVSVSVDPEHDTPEVLRAYAERAQAGEQWRFLTGERAPIRELIVAGFKLALEDAEDSAAPPGEAIVHSNRFVLVDDAGAIRGYYDAFDADERTRLQRELDALLGQ